MKFYFPYLLTIFLLLVAVVSAIAAIIATDRYVSGAFMLLFVASFLGASTLLIQSNSDNGNK